MQVDTVLYNARIYTMDQRHPRASALAIDGERIVALGGDELCTDLAPARAIDTGGRTVIPGMIDAHLHFTSYSLRLDQIEIYELPTLEQTLMRVAARAAGTAPGTWIRSGGWNCNLWRGGAFPTRYDLDRVAPTHPVALSSKDGHSLWVNSMALELAGITAATPDVAGGSIFRDASGAPSGILQENAIGLVRQVIPEPTFQERLAACRRGIQHAHRVGLTGVHNCEGEAALAVFQELARSGELTLRVLAHIPAAQLDAAIALGIQDGLGDAWLRLGGIKAFSDGALGSRSAWMIEPYEDDPGNWGIPTMTREELAMLVARANAAGLSVAVHAIGDAANRAVLDAIEGAQDVARPRLHNRIEHVQALHPDDLPRLAQLGVIASMQPIHATADIDIAERHWGARSATAYAWRSLLNEGTTLAFGSDAPVENIAPLVGIHAAVTRRRADGYPGPEGWYPEQALTVEEAVYAYTMGAAYASGEEQIKGSLTRGKLADLVLLERDIMTIDPIEIVDTPVAATVVGGQFVYGGDAP
ncbi:MAG: amidohydrolase [Anaerolineae bacterium]|nr:amidohydrolase [Anaerolineae bacterium]